MSIAINHRPQLMLGATEFERCFLHALSVAMKSVEVRCQFQNTPNNNNKHYSTRQYDDDKIS